MTPLQVTTAADTAIAVLGLAAGVTDLPAQEGEPSTWPASTVPRKIV
jgi:hypothetical protein